MSTIKTLQGWTFVLRYVSKDKGKGDSDGQHYEKTQSIDVSKTADGKPVKIFSQRDTGKYINHLFWRMEKGQPEDFKKLLETTGATKFHNSISMYDLSHDPQADTDIDIEVDNVCHAFASGLSVL